MDRNFFIIDLRVKSLELWSWWHFLSNDLHHKALQEKTPPSLGEFEPVQMDSNPHCN
jgi:hypothetical protein